MRLAKHCRSMDVVSVPWAGQLNSDGSINSLISSIMLWGGPGRIIIKSHFDLQTAAVWSAKGLGIENPEEMDEIVVTDFIREFSNLHAGYLRGLFEEHGLLFGISLPFIMAGNSERTLQSLHGVRVEKTAWGLSDGEHGIICTAEIELLDSRAIEAVQPGLEGALAKEKSGEAQDDSGDVEFLF